MPFIGNHNYFKVVSFNHFGLFGLVLWLCSGARPSWNHEEHIVLWCFWCVAQPCTTHPGSPTLDRPFSCRQESLNLLTRRQTPTPQGMLKHYCSGMSGVPLGPRISLDRPRSQRPCHGSAGDSGSWLRYTRLSFAQAESWWSSKSWLEFGGLMCLALVWVSNLGCSWWSSLNHWYELIWYLSDLFSEPFHF